MANDDIDALAVALLADESHERVEDYAKRGRQLASLGLDELRARWVQAIRDWANTPEEEYRDHRERDDIEAELTIRGEEPPLELVKDDWPKIQEKVRQAMKDSSHVEELQRSVMADLAKLHKARKDSH